MPSQLSAGGCRHAGWVGAGRYRQRTPTCPRPWVPAPLHAPRLQGGCHGISRSTQVWGTHQDGKPGCCPPALSRHLPSGPLPRLVRRGSHWVCSHRAATTMSPSPVIYTHTIAHAHVCHYTHMNTCGHTFIPKYLTLTHIQSHT